MLCVVFVMHAKNKARKECVSAQGSGSLGKPTPSLLPLSSCLLLLLPPLPQPPRFRLGRQEDAHEYLRCVLDAMHEAFLKHIRPKPPPELASTTFIHRIFGGKLRSEVGDLGGRGWAQPEPGHGFGSAAACCILSVGSFLTQLTWFVCISPSCCAALACADLLLSHRLCVRVLSTVRPRLTPSWT